MTKEELYDLIVHKNYTNDQLAAHFNCGVTTIKRRKKEFELVGLKTNARALSELEIKHIQSLITEGLNLNKIVTKSEISEYRIRKYISADWLKLLELNNRASNSNQQQIGTTKRFLEPTRHTAYMVGLLQADGCITADGYVSLVSKDKELAQQMAAFISGNLIKDNKGYYKAQVKDFKNFEKFKKVTGLLPRKTYINYEIPRWISCNKEFLEYFLVGVFNGDGSVVYKRENELTITVEQHSSQQKFLLEINNYLNWRTYTYPDKKESFIIKSSCRSTIEHFARFYVPNEFALSRKKDRFIERCKI